jgi:hypothetical protein
MSQIVRLTEAERKTHVIRVTAIAKIGAARGTVGFFTGEGELLMACAPLREFFYFSEDKIPLNAALCVRTEPPTGLRPSDIAQAHNLHLVFPPAPTDRDLSDRCKTDAAFCEKLRKLIASGVL